MAKLINKSYLLLIALAMFGFLFSCNMPQASEEKTLKPLSSDLTGTERIILGTHPNLALKNLGAQQYLLSSVIEWFQDWWGNWHPVMGATLSTYKSNCWELKTVDPSGEDYYLTFKLQDNDPYVSRYLCWPCDEDNDDLPAYGAALYYEEISKADEAYYIQAGYFPKRFCFNLTSQTRDSNGLWYFTLQCVTFSHWGYNVKVNQNNVAVIGTDYTASSYWRWEN